MAGSLSPDQREFFWREGYLAPLTALSEVEAADRLAALTAFERAGGGFGLRLRFKAHLRLAALMSIVCHPRILDAVESLIGPDILLFTSTLWPKNPGDRHFVSWHQDSDYFGLDPHDEVTAWIALTESDAANGCVRVMPRSHVAPDYSHDETFAPENMLIRGQAIRGLDESRAVDLVLRPGQFSLHQERTVHGSLPNGSDRRRIGYAAFYIPAHVRSTLGRRSALLIRGRDRYHHWDPDPEPQGDDDPAVETFISRTYTQYRDQESTPGAEA